MGGQAPVISSPLCLHPGAQRCCLANLSPQRGARDDIVCSGKSRQEFLFWTRGRRIRRPNFSNSREGSSNPRFSWFFVVFCC